MNAYRYLAPCMALMVGAAALGQTAPEPTRQQLETIWNGLIRDDDDGTQKAIGDLRALARSPRATVAFLKDHVKPVPIAESQRIMAAIRDLDSSDFQAREQGSKTLETFGVLAVPAIEKKLQEKPSLEVRQRLETILQKIDDRALTADELRSVRAVEVLEEIGTPDAQAVLQGLAKGGAGAILTEQARKALARLARRK